MNKCKIETCSNEAHKDDLCEMHWGLVRKSGISSFDFDFLLHSSLLIGGRILHKVLNFYNEFFSLDEKDTLTIHKNLVQHYRKKGNIGKAISSIKKVIDLDPSVKKGELFLMLAELYSLNGNHADAKATYHSYLKEHPTSYEALVGLAGTYYKENDIDNAIKYCEEARDINSNDDQLFFKLGLLYDKKKEQQKAIDCLESAIKISPETVKYHQHIGFLYESTGAHEKAVPHFKKVLELEQQDNTAKI